MSSKTYAELLKDPRWQKKRLVILERDGWKCRFCGEAKEALSVHHCFYYSTYKPWEYPDKSLITLCESCHGSEKEEKASFTEYLKIRMGGQGYLAMDISDLGDVIDFIEGQLGDGQHTVIKILRIILCQKGWTVEKKSLVGCIKKAMLSYRTKQTKRDKT